MSRLSKGERESAIQFQERLHAFTRPLAARISEAVRPLFTKEPRRPPILVGCCVLLTIDGVRFLLTAAHVTDELRDRGILIGGDGELTSVPGIVRHTEPPDGLTRDADLVDAAVVRVADGHLDELSKHFLHLKDLDVHEVQLPDAPYLLLGYPSSKANADGPTRNVSPRLQKLIAIGPDQATYSALGIHPASHVAIGFDIQRVVTSKGLTTAPKPAGMSGCGVWSLPSVRGVSKRDRLVAIFTEHRRGPKVLLATRVSAHLALMRASFPDIASRLPTPRYASYSVTGTEQSG